MSDEKDSEETQKDEDGGVTIEFVDEEGNLLFESYFEPKLWETIEAMASLSGISPKEFVMKALLDEYEKETGTDPQDEG